MSQHYIVGNKGRFPFNKTFTNFETGTNGNDISWVRFRKVRKLLKFRKPNHSTENSGDSLRKIEWNENY